MNAKRVSFSDVNDIFTIPSIEGTRKLLTPLKKDLIVYSDEDNRYAKERRTRYETPRNNSRILKGNTRNFISVYKNSTKKMTTTPMNMRYFTP